METPFEDRTRPMPRLRAVLRSDISRAAQKYLLAGGFCALLDWGLFALFLYGFGLHYIAAGTISFLLATGVNYFVSVRFVFGASRRGARQALALVYLVSAVGISINIGVLTVGVDMLGIHPMVTKVAASGVAVLWNFLARYFYIFK